ncbi:MAG: hypothetical protein PHI85_05010 [Victivallaceae bacterium]|nr:hypothetical protein [Victivallaceae bacterium]
MKCEYCDGLGRYIPAGRCHYDEVREEYYVVCGKCGGTGEVQSIKGVLIDPEKRTVSEVDVVLDHEGSSLHGMYDVLGCSCVDVGCGGLSFLPSRPDDDLWFDDEGLFRGDDCGCFMLPNSVPLVGRGLILGCDDNGRSIGHHLTAEDIDVLRSEVVFMDRLVAGK